MLSAGSATSLQWSFAPNFCVQRAEDGPAANEEPYIWSNIEDPKTHQASLQIRTLFWDFDRVFHVARMITTLIFEKHWLPVI